MDTIIIAKLLVTHIRQCFLCLLDGRTTRSKEKIDFWLAKFSNSSKYWHYPVVTASVLRHCLNIGIKVDDRIQELSGVHQLSAFLKAVEKPLRDILLGTIADDCSVYIHEEIEPAYYTDSAFERIPEIFKLLQTKPLPGISFFLHGSMADRKYTAFSDVDDLIVIDSSAWQDPESLMNSATLLTQVAREYQNIDPLQHHGHWVITEFDLLLYNQSYMPLVVFNEAIRITGKSQIKFRLTSDYSGFVRNARLTIQSISQRLQQAEQKEGINAFDLKCLVGEISLLPAYIFQTQGNMLSKPEAISRASELYTPTALEALKWSTRVRNEFAPLVYNQRTNILKTVAKLTCSRRHLAEKLHRKCSYWVSYQNALGLSHEIIRVIRSFAEESNSFVALSWEQCAV